MKKIKIMLTAITVLAVVGGALAFKAQKFSMKKVCYGNAANNCPNFTLNSTTTIDAPESYWYTTTNGTNCQGAVCSSQTYLTREPE